MINLLEIYKNKLNKILLICKETITIWKMIYKYIDFFILYFFIF